MITIIYKNKKVYINIDLIKIKLKSLFSKTLSIIKAVLVATSIFLIIGTIGSADLERISTTQMFNQLIVGFSGFGIAYILHIIKTIVK